MQLSFPRMPEPEIALVEVLDLPVIAGRRIVSRGTEHASVVDLVDEWGMQSFPASDPPANW